MSTVSSSSSDDTESTQTQSGFVSPPPPPIRNSITFDNLTEQTFVAATTVAAVAATINTNPNLPQAYPLNMHQPFRKCRSYVHLTKVPDRIQSSLIDPGHCDRLQKSASTPTAIYMAIKQEHRFLVHRIFNRCKVILI